MEVKDIPINQIDVSEFNTRKDLGAGTEDAGLEDLAESIRERGLLSPITVRPKGEKKFDVVAGQRRFLACKKLGMQSIPAIVRDNIEDPEATVISLIENVHRADMNPMDKARAYQRLYEEYGTYQEVARQVNIGATTVSKYVSLTKLAPTLQDKLSTAEGPAGVGTLSLLAEKFDPGEQEDILDRIGGFRQDIQRRMINQSGGDIGRLQELREEAIDDTFDLQMCREGLCFEMPDDMKSEVIQRLQQTSGETS